MWNPRLDRTVSRILVRRVCGLGDLILTLPFLQYLRHEHPAAKLHLLAHGEHAAFLQTLELVSRGYAEEGSGWHGLYSGKGVQWGGLRPDPRGYDLVYLFVPDPLHSSLLDALRGACGDRLKAIPSRPPAGEEIHASASFLNHILTSPRWPTAPYDSHVLLPERTGCSEAVGLRGEKADGLFPIMVHPGSGSARKNWPAQRFVELLRMLRALPGARPRVIEGPADEDPVRAIVTGIEGCPGVPVLRFSRILDLAACIREASLAIGNDSGVTHLSAYLGVPTIAIFGPSDPVRWSPMGATVRVLYREASCKPCHLMGQHPCDHDVCVRFPTVQDVLEAAREFLYAAPSAQKETC